MKFECVSCCCMGERGDISAQTAISLCFRYGVQEAIANLCKYHRAAMSDFMTLAETGYFEAEETAARRKEN